MRQCAICGKGSLMAGTRVLLRGHYNPTNWTRKYPNLQKTKLPTGKSGLVCTKCLKKLHEIRAVAAKPFSSAQGKPSGSTQGKPSGSAQGKSAEVTATPAAK